MTHLGNESTNEGSRARGADRARIALVLILALLLGGILWVGRTHESETPGDPAAPGPGQAGDGREAADGDGGADEPDIQIWDDEWGGDEEYTTWRGEVTVRVLSDSDAAPVEGAAVRLTLLYSEELPPHHEALTGADGRVTLPGCSSFVELMCRRAGYLVRFTESDGLSGEATVRLTPAEPLPGRVVLAGSGKPVPGARVFPWPEADWWDGKVDRILVTDEDGAFEVAGIPADRPVVFGVSADGFGSRRIRRAPDDAVRPFVIEIGRGGTIEGTVRNAAADPIPGAEVFVAEAGGDDPLNRPDRFVCVDLTAEQVEMLRMRTRSGEDGRYRFRGLAAPGDCIVFARAPGGLEFRSVPLVIRTEEDRVECDVTVAALGMIVPRVVYPGIDPEEVLDDARITRGGEWGYVPDHQKAVWIEEEETWALVDVPPGEHEVYFEPDGFLLSRKTVEVGPGQRVEVVFELDPGLSLTGTLVDPEGKPVSGHVGFHATRDGLEYWENGSAGEDGRFEIRPLPDAVGVLTVAPEGYVDYEVEGVRPGDDTGRLVVERAARVIGRLVGVESPQRVDSGIRDTEGRGSSGGSRVEVDGSFEFIGIRPGVPTTLFLKGKDRPAFVMRDIVLEPGEVLDLGEVRPPAPVSVTGVVVDASGAPVPWAHVRFDDWYQDQRVTTDRSGRFEMTGVTPGRSNLVVEVEGIPRAYQPADLTGDDIRIEIEIPRQGTILCHVRDEAGTPLPGLRCKLVPVGEDGGRVEARHSHHRTDSTGVLRIPVVPGRYTVEVGDGRDLALPCPEIVVTDGNDMRVELVVR